MASSKILISRKKWRMRLNNQLKLKNFKITQSVLKPLILNTSLNAHIFKSDYTKGVAFKQVFHSLLFFILFNCCYNLKNLIFYLNAPYFRDNLTRKKTISKSTQSLLSITQLL